MSKRIALHDHVMLNSVDLSEFCRSVEFSSEHERVDVSGFTASGANEYLAGATEQSVTLEMYGSYGTGEVHQTLYPLHLNRTVFPFEWRPDQNAAVSASNPQLEGNAQLFTYGPGGTRGEVDTFTVTLNAADDAGFAFVTAP